ncbi:MAG TPA: nucleotide disphospho-sugar-binding domain-containing protein [Acidimicrobiales bacterium]|nr:nucleotide disphospho-sugar-binding domain-containing protein [Acidimicrobiales bacterium]
MARILFVVPPLAGHVNPTVAVGAALAARGHDPSWVGHPDVVPPLLAPGAAFVPVDEAVPAEVIAAVAERSSGLRGPAALRFLWRDVLMPLATTMLPGVGRAVAAIDPDALVVDQQALAGAAAAELAGIPWATSATTSGELTDPLATMGRVGEWVRGLMTGFLLEAGLDPARAAALDPRFSPDLLVAFTTGALVGPIARFPAHYAFVGPSFAGRPDRSPFPWEWLQPGTPLVLVSLGTLNAHDGARFFGEAVAALGPLPVQAVVVANPGRVPDPPANVVVRPRIPQLTLLAHAAAVVTHGGHNTVCEALAHGLPLVVAPIRDDQPIVAQQVVEAGAGVRVRFGRVTAAGLRAAVEAVLGEPDYRRAAARVQSSFARAGGAGAAARRIEQALLVPARGRAAWN